MAAPLAASHRRPLRVGEFVVGEAARASMDVVLFRRSHCLHRRLVVAANRGIAAGDGGALADPLSAGAKVIDRLT